MKKENNQVSAKTNISNRIKQLRIEKNLTQHELAVKAGISKNTLWNYENNKRQPNIETINKIANALNISSYNLIKTVIDITEESITIKDLVILAHQNAVEHGCCEKINSKADRYEFIENNLMLLIRDMTKAHEFMYDDDSLKSILAEAFIKMADLCGELNFNLEEEIIKKFKRTTNKVNKDDLF